MAAETTLLLTLRPGDHVVLADDVYGGTYRLLTQVLGPWGLEMTTCDLADADALADAIRPTTRFVWVETPSNPLLKVVDIAGRRRARPRVGLPGRGRQHVRLARAAAAARCSAPTSWCTA